MYYKSIQIILYIEQLVKVLIKAIFNYYGLLNFILLIKDCYPLQSFDYFFTIISISSINLILSYIHK